jgi:SM-20-related protein
VEFKQADTSRLISHYDLLLTPNFLDDATCAAIIREADASESNRAMVYGQGDSGHVYDRVRKASRLELPPTTTEFVNRRLLEHMKTLEQHFSISLTDCEQPQFLRYGVGDFFVAHQDGNTGLLRLTSDAERKISVVIFLNRQDDRDADSYSGGSLKFSDYRAEQPYSEFELPVQRGMLVAFRAELTHEVTPVISGQRYSVVSWYR